MKKRLLLCFGIILCLTACQNDGQSVTKAGTTAGTTEAVETAPAPVTEAAESGERAADSESETDTEYVTPVASGWQFVPGYGICGPNQPVIYGLAPEGVQPEEKTDGAEVKVISAFCQDGYMSVRLEIRDYTVTLLPDDEVRELLKKERENEKLQEEGGSTAWDTSYFCLDEEQQIYGRSAFWDKVREQEKQGKRDLIRGTGIPETGFIFNGSGSLNEYAEFLEKGYYTTILEKRISRRQPFSAEPEGTYELSLNGFERPLKFAFTRVREYDDLKKVDGMEEHDGFYAMAQAQMTSDGMRLCLYAYPADGYYMKLMPDMLTYQMKDGETEEAVIARYNSAPISEWMECGFPKGGYWESLYQLPKDGTVESASCLILQPAIISKEKSAAITIPIPEGEARLEEKMEFRDAVVYLTGIKRLDERYDYGTDEKNQKITKPMAYVSARVEYKTADTSLEGIWGCQIGDGELEVHERYRSPLAMPDFKEGKEKGGGELRGFNTYYEDDDTELKLQFQDMTFSWNQEFLLPVAVENN